METVTYRAIKLEECELIKEIDASQYIGNAWREVDGKRKLVEINYQDLDFLNGYDYHLNKLKETIIGGGSALGVFNNKNKLIGFATVNKAIFGEKTKHVLLEQLFITLEERKKGLGKNLFVKSVDIVKEWNVDEFYICAGSAEETIPFYKSCGFQISHRVKNFFVDNYDKPIFEDGKQLIDMVYLSKNLKVWRNVKNI